MKYFGCTQVCSCTQSEMHKNQVLQHSSFFQSSHLPCVRSLSRSVLSLTLSLSLSLCCPFSFPLLFFFSWIFSSRHISSLIACDKLHHLSQEAGGSYSNLTATLRSCRRAWRPSLPHARGGAPAAAWLCWLRSLQLGIQAATTNYIYIYMVSRPRD